MELSVYALANVTHGGTIGGVESPEYSAWKRAKARCSNPNDARYSSYGGRGITMCLRWQSSFAAFLEDMGRKPTPKHSLERKENDGNYDPENCKWATAHEQMTIEGIPDL